MKTLLVIIAVSVFWMALLIPCEVKDARQLITLDQNKKDIEHLTSVNQEQQVRVFLLGETNKWAAATLKDWQDYAGSLRKWGNSCLLEVEPESTYRSLNRQFPKEPEARPAPVGANNLVVNWVLMFNGKVVTP